MAIKLTTAKIGDQEVTIKVSRNTGVFKAQMNDKVYESYHLGGLIDKLEEVYKDNIKTEWLHVVKVQLSDGQISIKVTWAAQIGDDLYLNSEPTKSGAYRLVHLKENVFTLPFGWSNKEDVAWTMFLPVEDLEEIEKAVDIIRIEEKRVKDCYNEQLDIFTKLIDDLADARRKQDGKV